MGEYITREHIEEKNKFTLQTIAENETANMQLYDAINVFRSNVQISRYNSDILEMVARWKNDPSTNSDVIDIYPSNEERLITISHTRKVKYIKEDPPGEITLPQTDVHLQIENMHYYVFYEPQKPDWFTRNNKVTFTEMK